jgi:AraC-like DNA-binding protein
MVSRALKLIEGGALDEGEVASLADRLEIGERQLRRLFRRHLGAAPITVAQTRRVLLAKQLLHQTDLSMIEGISSGSVCKNGLPEVTHELPIGVRGIANSDQCASACSLIDARGYPGSSSHVS